MSIFLNSPGGWFQIVSCWLMAGCLWGIRLRNIALPCPLLQPRCCWQPFQQLTRKMLQWTCQIKITVAFSLAESRRSRPLILISILFFFQIYIIWLQKIIWIHFGQRTCVAVCQLFFLWISTFDLCLWVDLALDCLWVDLGALQRLFFLFLFLFLNQIFLSFRMIKHATLQIKTLFSGTFVALMRFHIVFQQPHFFIQLIMIKKFGYCKSWLCLLVL